jgi:hypothetical protein
VLLRFEYGGKGDRRGGEANDELGCGNSTDKSGDLQLGWLVPPGRWLEQSKAKAKPDHKLSNLTKKLEAG